MVNNQIPVQKSKRTQKMLAPEVSFKKIEFYETRLMGPQAFSLTTGDFLIFSNFNLHPNMKIRNIGLQIVVRKSFQMLIQTQIKPLFEILVLGISFFEKFFAYPFESEKYDLIFFPISRKFKNSQNGLQFLDEKLLFHADSLNVTERNLRILQNLAKAWLVRVQISSL